MLLLAQVLTITCSASGKRHFLLLNLSQMKRSVNLTQNGGHLLGASQREALETVVTENGESNKEYIGKDAKVILEAAGITAPAQTVAVVVEVPADHEFVINEYLMPILPVVRVRDFDEALKGAVAADGGSRTYRNDTHQQHCAHHTIHKGDGLFRLLLSMHLPMLVVDWKAKAFWL